MKKTEALSAEEWKALAGSEVGVSDWVAVSQLLIDDFAEVTGDKQFIHVDPVRAQAESPYGGTVAHGFLTLSLLSVMARDALPDFKNARARINYGFDKIRFLAPVPAGSSIRARFHLLQVDERRPGELTLKYAVTVEVDGGKAPAVAAEWLSRVVLEKSA
jgi:acyl dehydratase